MKIRNIPITFSEMHIDEKRKNLLLKLICLLLHRLLKKKKLYNVHFYLRTVSPSYKRMLRRYVYTGCPLIVRIFQMI